MKAQSIINVQKEMDPKEPTFWLAEIALHVCRYTESYLSRAHGRGDKVKVEKSRRKNTYYAIEYVETYPIKIDKITRSKPTDGINFHTIQGYDHDDAKRRLIEKLNAERNNEQVPQEGEYLPPPDEEAA